MNLASSPPSRSSSPLRDHDITKVTGMPPPPPPLSVADAAFSGGGIEREREANERSSDYRAECEFLPPVVVAAAAAAVTTRRRCNNSVGFFTRRVGIKWRAKKALCPPFSFSRLFAEGLKKWVSICLRRGVVQPSPLSSLASRPYLSSMFFCISIVEL